jgi:hypothetical protein
MRDDAARALRVDDELLLDRPYERRFERASRPARTRTATAVRERPATAPGRAYGTHRRADAPVSHVRGAQPGRRTVEITGQAAAPRRRSSTQAAFAARPDRTAQWAFMFALFLLVMALVTAHG